MDKRESRQKVTEFLKTNTVAHLATLTHDEKPYVSTVYYHANELSEIFIITLEETKKYKNIKENNRVAIAITDELHLRTAQIQGLASEEHDPNIKRAILEKLAVLQARNRSGWPPPIIKLDKGGIRLLKVTPTWVRYSDFKDPENIIVFEDSLR